MIKKYLFWFLVIGLFPQAGRSVTPLFLGKEPNMTGIRRITNVGNFSQKNISENEYNETLADGSTIKILVRIPVKNGAPVQKVSAVVFVAPAPSDTFRTAKSVLASALVTRLGCAVVAIEMHAPKTQYWVRNQFYVYPESIYFPVVERAIKKAKGDFGDDGTPVFCMGISAGGVMALYMAQSSTLQVDGAVAFELSQDEANTPSLLNGKVPTLILQPEDSPWNARIARMHAEAVAGGSPSALCIARPIIDFTNSGFYARRAGGRYANELAYCFMRDAIEAKKKGEWPAKWQKIPVKIEAVGEAWEELAYCSSEDFEKIYKLCSHSVFELLPAGECTYTALPPFLRRHSILVVKKGVWSYLDQVRIGAMLVNQGCAAMVTSIPDAEVSGTYLPGQLARLQSLKLPVTIIAFDGEDASWRSAVTAAAGDVRCVWIQRGDTLLLPKAQGNRLEAILTARPDYKSEDAVQSTFFAEPTWILPKDFNDLLLFLIPPPEVVKGPEINEKPAKSAALLPALTR